MALLSWFLSAVKLFGRRPAMVLQFFRRLIFNLEVPLDINTQESRWMSINTFNNFNNNAHNNMNYLWERSPSFLPRKRKRWQQMWRKRMMIIWNSLRRRYLMWNLYLVKLQQMQLHSKSFSMSMLRLLLLEKINAPTANPSSSQCKLAFSCRNSNVDIVQCKRRNQEELWNVKCVINLFVTLVLNQMWTIQLQPMCFELWAIEWH